MMDWGETDLVLTFLDLFEVRCIPRQTGEDILAPPARKEAQLDWSIEV